MGFLDNSGDIILDAVLTDTGRFRLAKGDGTFRIAKFALGDDEINYSLYNQNHSSGSAYYDLEILQSPVLEAFTNNTSLMKSKLISIPRTNLLYLPIIKVKDLGPSTYFDAASLSNIYIVTVDEATEGNPDVTESSDTSFRDSGAGGTTYGVRGEGSGVLAGHRPSTSAHKNYIEVHQGLDTREIPSRFTMDSDLRETQYIIEMDSRLGSIVDKDGAQTAPVSFIDDDHVASYFISQATGGNFIDDISDDNSPILGPRGKKLMFKIKSSIELSTSTFLFTKLGSTMSQDGAGSRNFRFIDSTIRITGATTGYRIDIPVRFVKSTT